MAQVELFYCAGTMNKVSIVTILLLAINQSKYVLLLSSILPTFDHVDSYCQIFCSKRHPDCQSF